MEYTKKLWEDVKYNSPEEFMTRIQQVASTIPSSQANKIDRELYIGNLPSGITNQQLIDLLNTTIEKMNLSTNVIPTQPGNPVIAAWISNDGDYAFIEFRSVEEARAGRALNNVCVLGQPLRVGKPKAYAGSEPPSVSGLHALSATAVGLHSVSDEMASKILGGSGRLIVSGLPHGLRAEEIKPVLEGAGRLRCFDMPKDLLTGMTKGYAIFDYEEEECIASALSLTGTIVSGCPIKVTKVGKDSLASAFLPPMPNFDNRTKFTSRILVLRNMVKITDLENEEDYQDIHEDTLEECKKYGRVISIIVPRPSEHTSGIGKIFVEYSSVDEAIRAKSALTGLKFNEKKVECSYHPEELYFQGNFAGDG